MQAQIDRGKTLWLLCSPIIIPKVGFLDEYIYEQVEQLCQDSSPSKKKYLLLYIKLNID